MISPFNRLRRGVPRYTFMLAAGGTRSHFSRRLVIGVEKQPE
ncbi:MAG: hypothetical protein RMY34_22010 [Aulosira sp. DedQUE10]|nr:hypothetical protein [Aulosira sp. DedQUE10]